MCPFDSVAKALHSVWISGEFFRFLCRISTWVIFNERSALEWIEIVRMEYQTQYNTRMFSDESGSHKLLRANPDSTDKLWSRLANFWFLHKSVAYGFGFWFGYFVHVFHSRLFFVVFLLSLQCKTIAAVACALYFRTNNRAFQYTAEGKQIVEEVRACKLQM